MLPRYGLVLLVFAFTTVCETAMSNPATASSNRKTMETENDIREAVCNEKHLHPGTGLSCCGGRAFNPEEATCCKVENGHTKTAVTKGLGENVSACCELKAFNHHNEICCQSTVIAKPAPKAQCCGKEEINPDTHLCCGRKNNKTILAKNSSDHFCCGHNQFDSKTECCCWMEGEGFTVKPIESSCCDSAFCRKKAYNTFHELCCQRTVVAKPASNAQCCGDQEINPDTHLCCGRKNNKTILAKNSSDHFCCGHNQYDSKTECCCWMEGEGFTVKPIESSCCDSAFCRKEAYNTFHELCCQRTVVAKPASNAQCCGDQAINPDTHLCCGRKNNKTILAKNSSDHFCCGHNQYDSKTECCCWMEGEGFTVKPIESSCCDSAFCRKKAYNTFHELCCQRTVVAKPASNAQCCGDQEINPDTHLCCGRKNNKTILAKNSSDHFCCGHNQYDSKTECCCWMEGEGFTVKPIESSCCDSGVQQQKPTPQPICTAPDAKLCGSSCYNPNNFRCCEKKQQKSQWCSAQAMTMGRCADVPTVYNPHTHVCCSGCVSEWMPRIDESRGSRGQHFCGSEVYRPYTEICCDRQRHHKKENTHCCGVKAYNIKDKRMKCCRGTLHNVTIGHEAQCCGSVLQTPPNVCCSSEAMEVLYSAKTGFGCCGHLYYNSTLWSCCAGKLSPAHQPGQHQSKMIEESRLLSVNNLNEADLCDQIQIGTVESVSLHSLVFRSVLKIHGRNGTVTPLASPYVLKTSGHCSFPELIPGQNYYFDKVNVFTDFDHDCIFQSLHFIISKCYRP